MPKKKSTTAQKRQSADPIDEAYASYSKKKSGKYSKKKNHTKTKVGAVIVILLAICVCIAVGLIFTGKLGTNLKLPSLNAIIPGNTIASGVTVAGVDVGGMTKEEATDTLEQQLHDVFSTTTVTATVLDRQWELSPTLSEAALDIGGAVKAALTCKANTCVDIIPHLNLNTQAIADSIADFALFFPTEGQQSSYEIVTNEENVEVLKITIGTDYYDFDETKFYTALLEAMNNGSFVFNYPCKQLNLTEIDLDAIYAEHCTEPIEATWDAEKYEATQSSDGYRFDLETAKEALAAAKPGDILEFPLLDVQPEMSTEKLQSMLFRDQLGTYTAYSSSSYNRDTNLWLACQSINGVILNPGDTFSYNAALGERTPEKGYKPAASYMGNETVNTYGGGICQPSSSLYYAALIADLEIVQRSCHGFVSSYMPLGMDATVDWNGPDFKFRNDSEFPIRIDAVASGGTVTVTLVGTDMRDYYVEMEYEVLGTTYPSTKEIVVEAGSGHYDGEVKTSAYTGYTVQTYKLKYDKETNALISREKEAYSVYSKRDKEVYKIKKVEEATEPTTEPTEPSTDSSTETTETTTPTTATPETESTTAPTTETPPPPDTESPPPANPDPPIGEAGGDVQLPNE